jgi:hypothetical protein
LKFKKNIVFSEKIVALHKNDRGGYVFLGRIKRKVFLHCNIRPLFQGKYTYDCMIALASLKKNSYKQGKNCFHQTINTAGRDGFFRLGAADPLRPKEKCGGGRRVWGPAHPPSGMAIVGGLRYAFGRFLPLDWMHQHRLVNVKIAGVEVLIWDSHGAVPVG